MKNVKIWIEFNDKNKFIFLMFFKIYDIYDY